MNSLCYFLSKAQASGLDETDFVQLQMAMIAIQSVSLNQLHLLQQQHNGANSSLECPAPAGVLMMPCGGGSSRSTPPAGSKKRSHSAVMGSGSSSSSSSSPSSSSSSSASSSSSRKRVHGRVCADCRTSQTSQWRTGPDGKPS